MSFGRGIEVFLYLHGQLVGKGIVIKDKSIDILQGKAIGISRVAVSMTEVFDQDAFLPYLVKGLLTLGDAIDENILWDRVALHLHPQPVAAELIPHFDEVVLKAC
jgi:hypothetical protein